MLVSLFVNSANYTRVIKSDGLSIREKKFLRLLARVIQIRK